MGLKTTRFVTYAMTCVENEIEGIRQRLRRAGCTMVDSSENTSETASPWEGLAGRISDGSVTTEDSSDCVKGEVVFVERAQNGGIRKCGIEAGVELKKWSSR